MRMRLAHRRGGALLEALLALALVSFGALSAAMLQLSSRRSHAEGQQRALAAQLAEDYAAQLRAAEDPSALLGSAPPSSTTPLIWPVACISSQDPGHYRIVLAWRGLVAQPEPADACGRDPQPDGALHYSRALNDNAYRRTLTLPLTVARSLR